MFSPELKKGSMEMLILSLCAEEDLHGYGIGKKIEERSDGCLVFRVSSLYPTLSRLEERGWLEGRWVEKPGERRRRYYHLTADGHRALARQRELWGSYVSTVDRVLRPAHG